MLRKCSLSGRRKGGDNCFVGKMAHQMALHDAALFASPKRSKFQLQLKIFSFDFKPTQHKKSTCSSSSAASTISYDDESDESMPF